MGQAAACCWLAPPTSVPGFSRPTSIAGQTLVRPSTGDGPLPSTTTDLRGHRHRILGGDCANEYPAHLEFQKTRYAGTKDGSTQISIIWDAGSYRVASESVERILAATDAQHRYRHRVDRDRLTFVDNAGCAFAYERDAPARSSAAQ
jgi:hypothetical protein